MQSVIEETEEKERTRAQFRPSQISKLFSFEAEYSKSFSERTVVLPAVMESSLEVTSQLTDDVWLIINGEKGSGKTSCLYYTRRGLQAQSRAGEVIPAYIAFDSDDIKRDIASVEEKTDFLVRYFYRPFLREMAQYLNSSGGRNARESERRIFAKMVDSLGLSQEDFRFSFPEKERKSSFTAWLLKLFGITHPDDSVSRNSDRSSSSQNLSQDQGPAPNQAQSPSHRADYSAFRDSLIELADSIGAARIYLLVDEVNEQRLSRSEQEALFDHLYNTYRTVKDRVTVKIATTSSVAIPDFIFHGHYFMPMELSSVLLHPFGYERMVQEIFEVRLQALSSEAILREKPGSHVTDASSSGAGQKEPDNQMQFSDFFTENSFHTLVQASMGNVREFFFLAKMAYNHSLPAGKIELVDAQRVIRSRGSEIERRLSESGREPLNAMYLRLISLLKERSEAKAARRLTGRKQATTPKEEGRETEEQRGEGEKGNEISQSETDNASSCGVSYFVISNYDSLSNDERVLIDKLEDERVIFSTGEWKSLRRKGERQQMFAISYPVCSLRGIQWCDVSSLVQQGMGTERELIDQNRCQITI